MDLFCNPFSRLRVLANEVEILQGSATLKTKQLKKAELNHAQHWEVSIFCTLLDRNWQFSFQFSDSYEL